MRFVKTAAALSALALVGLASPASAGVNDFEVSVAGTSASQVPFTAETKDGVDFVVHHGSTNHSMPCTSSTFDGVINTGNIDNPLADLTSSTWIGCTFAGSGVGVTHNGTWHLNGDHDGSATSGVDHAINGSVTSISASLSLLGGLCNITVGGTVDVVFDEEVLKDNGTPNDPSDDYYTQQITVTGSSLQVTSASLGCLGQVSVGDPADFNAAYNVTVFDGDGHPILGTPINIAEK